MAERGFWIPGDPEKRKAFYDEAGLSDEERHALDLWCFNEEQKRSRGVSLWDNEGRWASDGETDK